MDVNIPDGRNIKCSEMDGIELDYSHVITFMIRLYPPIRIRGLGIDRMQLFTTEHGLLELEEATYFLYKLFIVHITVLYAFFISLGWWGSADAEIEVLPSGSPGLSKVPAF